MQRITRILAVILILFTPGASLFSEDTAAPVQTPAEEAMYRVMLAEATPEYPVTPGDTYILSYVSSLGTQSVTVTVQSDYTLTLGIFGVIDTAGLTLPDLRARMKTAVTRAYPGSYPTMLLTRSGAFTVFVKGEVIASYHAPAWGLTRLSEVLTDHLTPHASLRNVRVTGRSGSGRTYDLFKAARYGAVADDSYLRPGDTVTLEKADRTVSLWGKVMRSGVYQLLPGETLRDLLEVYGDGFVPGADTERITIQRRVEDDSIYEAFQVDVGIVQAATVPLKDADIVNVPDRSERLPVVYFEGALAPTEKLRYSLKKGDTLYRALLSIRDKIAPEADLSSAVLIKPGSTVQAPVNLEKILYTAPRSGDFELAAGDRIIIPYGALQVFVSGEVTEADWVSVKPLSRLSEILEKRLTLYSSTRDVEIASANGQTQVYDLFLAQRFGRQEEDPYLAPGDRITVDRLERRVTVQGEVERPGTYQLTKGEELSELISYYGSGFTKMADPAEVELIRYDTRNGTVAETIYIDCVDPAWKEYQLRDLDRIIVPPKTRKLPFVLFEGAVYRERAIQDGTALETSNRIQYAFEDGELMSSAMQSMSRYFTEVSDLKNSYIVHSDGTTESIDLELLLFRQPDAKDIQLKSFDRIIVPFRQFFVIVSGAVEIPDRYPYIPDRTYAYYIDLAGGFDPERHTGDAVVITDINNNLLSPNDPIGPETKIVAPSNNPLYLFGRISGILGTIISIAALVISLLP